MLDHLGLNVRSLDASRAFYGPALAALGYGPVVDLPDRTAFGPDGRPLFWLYPRRTGDDPTPIHVAFVAPARQAVDAFFRAGLAAGGRDNGAPGLRPDYHPRYYAAFVIDPDGNNVEAVCHSSASEE